MKIKAVNRGSRRGWIAEILDDDDKVIISTKFESRPGCAIRSALNELQATYGEPHTTVIEWSLDEW